MKARYLYSIALAVVLLDQVTKFLIVNHLPVGSSVPIVGSVVYLTNVRNSGGAFGLFQSWGGLITMISIVVVLGIVILVGIIRVKRIPPVLGVALALQLGGASGNLIDRIRYNYVVDFIDLRVWPVFNIADSSITVGILLLAYHILLGDNKQKAAVTETAAKG